MAIGDGHGAPVHRARRDPEGRRRAIVEAAAELIVEEGPGDLTHRRVAERARVPLGATTYYFSSLEELREAALQRLADRIDEELRGIAEELAAADGDPAVLAEALHACLADRGQVRADAALYFAAIRRPALRSLALRWFDGLTEILSAHTDPDAARAVAVFSDGATVHAVLHDEPLDVAALTHTITTLMRRGTSRSRSEGRTG
ncbi:TetR/AcrR family transcriptional regulator [Streptomyces megasporus]|uniref:TetR/AcrR family transcriptional regulator n=1 Tax=Streptomyces megasporus TaxID=44060 RepID=UPI000A6CA9B7|nr:TetR family transcriptional regulator [Streptomyces megasporus]